jgi:hypothetical protein
MEENFAADYRQRVNGTWLSLDEVTAHFKLLRNAVESAEIRILDEFTDDGKYADRHIVKVHKKDGLTTTQEVYVFATLDDQGRFRTIEETTLMLDGDEKDRNIGGALS